MALAQTSSCSWRVLPVWREAAEAQAVGANSYG